MSQIYCSNCGQLIPYNSNFCRFCGAPQHGQEAKAYHAQAPTILPGTPVPNEVPSKRQTITKSHLDAMVIFVFLGNYVKSTSFLLPLLIVGAFFQPILFVSIIVGFLLTLILIGILAYKNFVYEVNELGLVIKFGIVHHKTITIPFSQVQNVNIERSLFDRMLGLARVSIETAGSAQTQPIHVIGGYTARSEAYVPGLSLKKAMILHDILIDGKIDEGDE